MANNSGGFEISPEGVRSGAGMVDEAVPMVHSARKLLNDAEHESTIFGGSDRAQTFGRTLKAKRDEHVSKMDGHHTNLETLSGDATTIANNFDTVDRRR